MRIVVLIVLLVSAFSASAVTRYVSDDLQITLRTGPTNQHRITKMLNSGDRLEVLEFQEGWAHVRTAAGDEGWVLGRYLIDTPVARDRLQQATATASRLREENSALKQQVASLQNELQQTKQQLQGVSQSNETMKQRLDEAARGLSLADENKALKKEIVDLEREIETLSNDVKRLKDRTRFEQFVYGAAVFLAGMLAVVIVPRLRPRKRSSWNNL